MHPLLVKHELVSSHFTAALKARNEVWHMASLQRPAAVLLDHHVNLRHQPDGFGEGDDDFW